jgi:DNA-binding MarR family transcriptional regulator
MAISRKASKADLENYNLDDSIPYMMNRVAGRLNRSLEDDLLKLGVTFQHWRVLAVLARGDGMSIADLSGYAVVPHSTLSRLLTRLEGDKLVERSAETPDGRTARVLITARGRRLYERILPLATGWRDAALIGFTTAEKDALLAFLRKMLANLDNSEGRVVS